MELSKPLIAERNIVKGSKYLLYIKYQLMAKIVLGLNDTSTFVGHFVSSPRKREKRDSRGDERLGRKKNRNEREENRRNKKKHSSSTLTCYKDSKPYPTVSQYQLDALVT